MSEGAMWDALRPVLADWDPVRIESPITAGVPDVNYTQGWIELKYLPEWPKRPATPVRIEHFTKEQRVWHLRRCGMGGKTFLMLKVGKGIKSEWLFFNGYLAAHFVGKVPREGLYKISIYNGKKPTAKELGKWL